MKRHALILLFLTFVLSSLAAAGKLYKGAEYRTKASYLYGRFEVRMKSAGREGMLASFFTYNDDYPTTPWNEIDIEILGRYTDDVQFNTITPGQVNHVSHQWVNFDPSQDYHVYAFEWTPQYVAWFIDSVEVVRQTGEHIASLSYPQKLMMNVWNPSAANWAGNWNEGVLPAFAFYDWVKYASYTPGSGSVGSNNNFSPQWMDDFDVWDQSRWDKATHTWNGNNCDFVTDNAVLQNGRLVLCLTTAASPGFVDSAPPVLLWARGEGATARLYFSEELDRPTAETAGNYIFAGRSVTQARLREDLRTVELSVPGLDTLSSAIVIVQNVRDCAPFPNTIILEATPLVMQKPLSLPILVNTGGGATGAYAADQSWGPSVEYGHLDGATSNFPGVTVAGASDPDVFRSELYDFCEYKIRVPVGQYSVTLMMAENYFTDPQQRVVTYVVEGVAVEAGLDLVSQVGFRTAYERTAVVNAQDGVIDIHGQGLRDKPLLNGIRVEAVSTGLNDDGTDAADERMFRIINNFPNPFNGGTMIVFALPSADRLTLRVFDTCGRVVACRSLGEFPAGESIIRWNPVGDNGAALPSGVYFCMLEGSKRTRVHKLVYLK